MPFSFRAPKSLNSIEKLQPRMMVATFSGNQNTTIISCYSPTNASDETDLIAFKMSYFPLSVAFPLLKGKNVLIIVRDMNAQIGKYISSKHTITLGNKFDAFQEISETLTPNDEYENFVNAHVEAATECILTILRATHTVP